MKNVVDFRVHVPEGEHINGSTEKLDNPESLTVGQTVPLDVSGVIGEYLIISIGQRPYQEGDYRIWLHVKPV